MSCLSRAKLTKSEQWAGKGKDLNAELTRQCGYARISGSVADHSLVVSLPRWPAKLTAVKQSESLVDVVSCPTFSLSADLRSLDADAVSFIQISKSTQMQW